MPPLCPIVPPWTLQHPCSASHSDWNSARILPSHLIQSIQEHRFFFSVVFFSSLSLLKNTMLMSIGWLPSCNCRFFREESSGGAAVSAHSSPLNPGALLLQPGSPPCVCPPLGHWELFPLSPLRSLRLHVLFSKHLQICSPLGDFPSRSANRHRWYRLGSAECTPWGAQKQRKLHRDYIPHVVAPPLPVHRAPYNTSCCILTSPSSPGVLPPLLFSRRHLLELFLEPSPLKHFVYYSYIPTRRHWNHYLFSLGRPSVYLNLARVEICSSRVPHKQVSKPCVKTLVKNYWVIFGDNCFFFTSKSITKIICGS